MDDAASSREGGPADLAGRIALVTGGPGGPGPVIARRLAAAGATVILTAEDAGLPGHGDAGTRIARAGGSVRAIGVPRGGPGAAATLFAGIRARYGRLDVLVSTVSEGQDAGEGTPAGTSLAWALACAREARPLMAQAGGGSIVSVPVPGADATARAALESLTRYLAAEFAPDGIRVNAAAGMPAATGEAPPADSQAPRVTPLGRPGTPAEFAEVVAFLAGPGARWITGQTILADGGLSAATARQPLPGDRDAGDRALADALRAQHAEVPPYLAAVPGTPGGRGDAPGQPRQAEAMIGQHPGRGGVPGQAARASDRPARPPVTPPAPAPGTLSQVVAAAVPAEPVEDEIVVVGMGMAVAGANSPEEFWRELVDGADRFVQVPPERWGIDGFYSPDRTASDKTYSSRSAFITDFRPARGAEPAATGGVPEYTTSWLRHAVVQSLTGVHHDASDRVSVFVGYTADGSQHLEEAGVVTGVHVYGDDLLGPGPGEADGQRAERLDAALRARYPRSGPDPERFLPHRVGREAVAGVLPEDADVVMVDTACSSSLCTIDLGVKALREDRADMVVAGGAFALAPRGSVLFSKLDGLSASGEVRSLDADGDGLLFADGAAAVVLKRLSRARVDGDTVLATIASVGTSSDGRGKVSYAPRPAGQKLAIERAQAGHDLAPAWVVAHATGTPAGDLAEYATLRDVYGSRPVPVSSNKSIVGHTGWAAGAVSVIEAVLGLAHDTVPRQHRFARTPEQFGADQDLLIVPTRDLPLPPRSQRRTVAVSGFGFGGANSHVLVQDPPPVNSPVRSCAPDPDPAERIAVVAISTHTPDGGAASFGQHYPLPPVSEVIMPPGVMRALDRAQLMVLAAARRIKESLPQFWDANRSSIGVLLGHFGPTGNALRYAARCYLDDLRAMGDSGELAGADWYPGFVDQVAARVRAQVPGASEDTCAGTMPNAISSRVASYYDLQGINMTLDTGFTAAARAIDLACSYLRAGDLVMALAGGINGNSTEQMARLVHPLLAGERVLHEGAFLTALVTESTARIAGLPIMGFIEAGPRPPGCPAGPQDDDELVISAGAAAGTRESCFLGGEGAYALTEAVRRIAGHEAARIRIDVAGGPGGADAIIRLSQASPGPGPGDDGDHAGGLQEQPATGPGTVRRHTVTLVPSIGRKVADPIPFWPGAPTVVLTNSAVVARTACEQVASVLLAGGTWPPAGEPGEGRPYEPPLPEEEAARRVHLLPARPGEQDVRAALGSLTSARGPVHVRVVLDITALTPGRRRGEGSGGTVVAGTTTGATLPAEQAADDLHQAAFLVLKALSGQLARSGASVITVAGCTPAREACVPAIEAGLFRGLTKVAALEYGQARVFMLIIDAPLRDAGDVAALARAAERESELSRALPVVYSKAGVRRIERLVAAPVTEGEAALGRDSRVVALGGGRGLTAELLTGLAREYAPEIIVLGSNDIYSYEPRLLQASDAEFAAARLRFIRTWLAAHGGSPRRAQAAFARIAQARTVLANLERMRAHGARVHYICADATDPQAVKAAVAGILSDGDVDVLINAAGISRSGPIAAKPLEEFCAVRDLKLSAFRSLRAAFTGRMPQLWINFGSVAGLAGAAGAAGEACADDFLAAAAAAANTLAGLPSGNDCTPLPGWHAARAGARLPAMTTIGWARRGDPDRSTPAPGQYPAMPAAEGLRHFQGELACVPPPAFTVYLGEAGRAAMEQVAPGLLADDPGPADASADASGQERGAGARDDGERSYFIDRVVRRSADHIIAEREFSLPRDALLAGYAVGGVATLPGMFVPELIAQVASRVVPGMVLHAVEDLRFVHLLKIHHGASVTYRMTGTRVPAPRGQAKVAVMVSSDVVSSSGKTLIADRVHFQATALLAPEYPPAPAWPAWPELGETPVPDPYHAPGAPVLLTGPFVSTTDTRLHPYGRRAAYRPEVPADSPWAQWSTPGLLLDGLARMGSLGISGDGFVPLSVPLSVARIDFFEHLSDVTAQERYGHLDLYAAIERRGFLGPDNETLEAANRFAAVAPDGRVVLRFRDLQWTIMGEFNPSSGEFVAPGAGARRAGLLRGQL